MAQLVVALDFQTQAEAVAMAAKVQGVAPWMKVGLELFVAEGPGIVRELKALGFKVFVDLKFLDIPNTVRGAVRSCVKSGADMLNIHACGGVDMARVAVAARDEAAAEMALAAKPLLFAVTVLTSMMDPSLPVLNGREPAAVVLELAKASRAAGLDGVVCSGQEAARIKAECGPDFLCLTPGIRIPDPSATTSAQGDDQRRVMTPEAAVAAGSDYLVVGRPITRAVDPAQSARDILRRMAQA
ncbi:MAG: orotidine-5'-phosphate decarboxylase [Humidesulfovibrio sp.]|uniref:orotidine-5'-phosphate decarboxylase n=1 Tax=Humidesulfovibrio sp. TaxID=2910988 RepID=UPI0027ED5DA9|nr:orotidine-5'-phosphate decarboxylase [Humidesulfovibrio sp.]MDQ7834141.1 orotidine-5'-phosphate decarboxylase [Humidesulfovibrio sp.]